METLFDIWTELGASLRRFVGSRVKDAAAADDITQDVMLKVQRQLEAMPAADRLPAWVFSIARNAIVDHYRAQALRGHASIDDHDPAAPSAAEQADAIRDLAPCVVRIVEQLPEPYRTAMKQADLEGLSQQQVADRAGISLSGAKSRIQRARQMLREMIEDCCKIERDGRGNVFDYETTDRSSRYCGDDTSHCGK